MNTVLPQASSPQPLLSAQADNARSLIIVLSIMAFLATLALLFSLSADRLRKNWQGELGRSVTVQIMVDNPELRDAKIETALSALKTAFPKASICLLYTSPSPRDRTRSRMPSSA